MTSISRIACCIGASIFFVGPSFATSAKEKMDATRKSGGNLAEEARADKKPNNVKQEKVKAAQEGKAKSEARQDETGRGGKNFERQGNHDSLTKGGSNDMHDNGTRQSGKAGRPKTK